MKKAERKDRGSNGHPASLVFWGGNTTQATNTKRFNTHNGES